MCVDVFAKSFTVTSFDCFKISSKVFIALDLAGNVRLAIRPPLYAEMTTRLSYFD